MTISQVLQFLSMNSFIIFTFLGVLVAVLAVIFKKGKHIITSFHIVLLGFLFNMLYPPITPCSYSMSEEAYSESMSIGSWSFETTVCKFYIATFPNITLAQFKLPHPLIYYLAPILVFMIVSFASLSLKIPKFWTSTVYIIAFSILTSYLTRDVIINEFYFTTATIWTYMLIPSVLAILISLTSPFGGK